VSGYKAEPTERSLTLKLNKERYRELVEAKGWDTQVKQANGLGLGQATVSRLTEADARPGPNAVAALITAFPEEPFLRLFRIEETRRSA
jgi:hypothetical protein